MVAAAATTPSHHSLSLSPAALPPFLPYCSFKIHPFLPQLVAAASGVNFTLRYSATSAAAGATTGAGYLSLPALGLAACCCCYHICHLLQHGCYCRRDCCCWYFCPTPVPSRPPQLAAAASLLPPVAPWLRPPARPLLILLDRY